MDIGVAATFDRQLPERLHSLQRLSGLPVVFGGSAAATPAGHRLTISRLVGTLGSSLGGLQVAPGRGLGGAVLQQGTAQRQAARVRRQPCVDEEYPVVQQHRVK